MRATCALVAVAAAMSFAATGIAYGTFAAGGSDSSCYALMADAFARGRLQPTSELAARVPWPNALSTFTPGGFAPSETTPSAFAPICAPGFSLLLAPFAAMGGQTAMFAVTPIFGALLVFGAYLAARSLAGPLAGAAAAVLVASSPIALYQVVQPMNDVTTAALWMGAYAALVASRWGVAGLYVGLALLVRPNLLPMGIVAGAFLAARHVGRRRALHFALAAVPGIAAVLWFNHQLYGGPLRTGYGSPEQLFALTSVPINAPKYLGWLVDTQTAFPLIAMAAPLALSHAARAPAVLGLALMVANVLVYLFYTPFDDWSYLRFLLPGLGLLLVLAASVLVRVVERFTWRPAIPVMIVTAGLAAFSLRAAEDRQAFRLWHFEQRYRSAGLVVRDRLPANALVFSVWDSGAVRFHAGREAVSWEQLDPVWLDRSLTWLREHRYHPYILVESWEEPRFRDRFLAASENGRLDWPPRFEVDRVVRIFDPADRERYHRGEYIATENLWPLAEPRRPD